MLGRLGSSLSFSESGEFLAVGVPAESRSENQTGFVRVLRRDENQDWQKYGNDITGLAPNDQFGQSLSISNDGSTIIVGAPSFDIPRILN